MEGMRDEELTDGPEDESEEQGPEDEASVPSVNIRLVER